MAAAFQVFREEEDIGKRLKTSKKRIFWRFGFMSEPEQKHEVILVHSLMSGKKNAFLNGTKVHSSQSMKPSAYNTGHKRMAISDNYLLKRIAAVMFIYCVLMISWYLNDEVTRKANVQGGLVRYNEEGTEIIPTIESCVWGKPLYNMIMAGLTGFLLIGVMVLCFLARKIPSAFNEGKHVFQAVVCSVLMATVFLVNYLMGVQGTLPDVYLAIFSVTINLVSLSFVFMIFIPKFKLILSKKELDVSDLTR